LSRYGLSGKNKKPTHGGLRLDMDAAVNFAIEKRNKGKGTKIVLYGHSIGGAVVIDYVSRHPRVV
jgi:alpha-beta hydrolase superfamily lysophospholipase